MRRTILAAAVALSLVPQLARAEPSDAGVRVITDEATRKSCRYLGLVTVRKSMGINKSGGALKKALAKTAEMGGNRLFLISETQALLEGASVNGEALLCPEDR